jgi:hypothetical protein
MIQYLPFAHPPLNAEGVGYNPKKGAPYTNHRQLGTEEDNDFAGLVERRLGALLRSLMLPRRP